MSYSFVRDLRDIEKFEKYIQSLLDAYTLDSNISSNTSITSSSRNEETNVIDLNFPSNLTAEQYAILEQAISSYVEPPTDENLYRTKPCVFTQLSLTNQNFTTINSILYSGIYYSDILAKIKVNSRINPTKANESNLCYTLRAVDITNNIVLGSNNLYNLEYEYNTIPLSNVSNETSTIEIQGKKGITGSSFDVNGAQLVYLFK